MNNKEKLDPKKEIEIVKGQFNKMKDDDGKVNVNQFDSIFDKLDLDDARKEGESREDYKLRRKRNKHILKLYRKHGRDLFKQAFPDGITETSIEQLIKEREKAIENAEKNR